MPYVPTIATPQLHGGWAGLWADHLEGCSAPHLEGCRAPAVGGAATAAPLVLRTPRLHLGSGQQYWADAYELRPDALLAVAAAGEATGEATGEGEGEGGNGAALDVRLGRASFNPQQLRPPARAPLRVVPPQAACADTHDCRACHALLDVDADTSLSGGGGGGSVFANASDLSGAIGVMPHAEAGYRLAACYNPLPLHPF